MEQERNFAQNKTRKVAWFVSNCSARNGRLQYAHELQKYIQVNIYGANVFIINTFHSNIEFFNKFPQVDIYGACGNYKCSRSTADKCFEILDRDYKFYLAFENSNCKDYITEKFFVNSLQVRIVVCSV